MSFAFKFPKSGEATRASTADLRPLLENLRASASTEALIQAAASDGALPEYRAGLKGALTRLLAPLMIGPRLVAHRPRWSRRRFRRWQAAFLRKLMKRRRLAAKVRRRAGVGPHVQPLGMAKSRIQPVRFNVPVYRVLEPRMVFDGAAADAANQTADAADANTAADGQDHAANADVPDAGDVVAALAEAPQAPAESARTIVFIDASVQDPDAIAAAVPEGAEVIYLDKTEDGLLQIADALAGRTDIDSIHIVSHGEAGVLYLGSSKISSENIDSYSASLSTIGSALSENADILVYGCDVAFGVEGEAFMQRFAAATGADVAASTDDTGSTELGGDWDLETAVGVIETGTLQPVSWAHLLAPITFNNLNGTTVTADTLADNIAGSGVTVVSTSFSGDNSQGGTFTSATGYPAEWLAFDSGVILSTGSTASVLGPNIADNTTVNAPGTGTDADFTTIGGGITSFDTAALSISFIPTSNRITLQFVFGSEEYNEYVYANFNDAIGVWVNGQHVSVTPAGSPISIDTINQAATYNPANGSQTRDHIPGNGIFDSASPSLFINNTPNAGTYNTAMDGFTVTLSLIANVNVGVANTIKIGVADIGDASFDSWLFVRENSLQATTIANTDFATTNVNTAVTISPLSNDTDSDGDPLTVTHVADMPIVAGGAAVTLASGGTVQLTLAGTFIYTPPAGFTGYEDFTYAISDGNGTTAIGFVHVDIGANTPPIVDLNDNGTSAGRDNTVTYNEGSAAIAVATGTASIIDPNDFSYPSLGITLGGFLGGSNEIISIGGTDFAYGSAQTSAVHLGATSFEITYDGANGISIENAAPDSEMPDATLEQLIRSITYRHLGDNPIAGARTLSFLVNDGQADSNIAVATVNVTAANDAPVNTLPATYTAGTSSAIALTGLSVADPDAGSGPITVSLSVSSGTLTALSGSGVTVSGSGSAAITLTGTLADINSYLVSTPPSFATTAIGTTTLTMVTNDQGNTGTGGALSDTDAASITVVAGPVLDLNSTFTTSTGSSSATSNLVTNGTFADNSSAPSGWTESGGIGTGASGRYIWISSTDSITQALTVPANSMSVTELVAAGVKTTTETVVTSSGITAIAFDMAWQNADTGGANDNRLSVAYGGVTYAVFTTGGGAGANGAWSYVGPVGGSVSVGTIAAVGDEVDGHVDFRDHQSALRHHDIRQPGVLVCQRAFRRGQRRSGHRQRRRQQHCDDNDDNLHS